MAQMVRINTRISSLLNEWLDKRSEITGVPKSTLVFLALEQYMTQVETMGKMGDIALLIEKIEQIQEKTKE